MVDLLTVSLSDSLKRFLWNIFRFWAVRMEIKSFRDLVCWLLIPALLATSMPTAAELGVTSEPQVGAVSALGTGEYEYTRGAATGQFDAVWRPYPATPMLTVLVPNTPWRTVARSRESLGEGRIAGKMTDAEVLQGQGWTLRADETSGALGLNSDQIVQATKRFAGTAPIVFAKYVPATRQLRISAVRVIRGANGFNEIQQSDYTPHHGEIIRAQRYFLTSAEKNNQTFAGYNPFNSFRGSNTDPVFYDIDPGAAQVATGWAIGHFRASSAVFVESKLGLDQTIKKGGGWLRRKITTTTNYRAQPKFFVAVPLQASAQHGLDNEGLIGRICVTGQTRCDDPAHIMFSGVILDELSGGLMPEDEQLIKTDVETKRVWTVLAYALLTAALVYFGGAIVAGEAGWAFAGSAGPVGAGAAGAAEVVAGSTIASTAGAGYAGITAITSGQSITAPQSEFAGRVGVDPAAVGSGYAPATECKNKYCKTLGNTGNAFQVDQRLVNADTNEVNGLAGVQAVARGNCATDRTMSACTTDRKVVGVMPRSDMYLETRMSEVMALNVAVCKKNGLIPGTSIFNKCIAPVGVLPPIE